MKLGDFVVREAIIANLAATTKDDAIVEILDSLCHTGHVKPEERDSVFAAIMKREELGSTGIGNGVAVPHTKHPSVARMVATVAVSKGKLDFNSIDREPVDLIVLLVSPPDRPGDHLRALQLISQHVKEELFCRFIRQSTTPAAIADVLVDADEGKLF
jgi:PTS system fructose-specific IIA component/PTS system nitrogen regulatory IIA component